MVLGLCLGNVVWSAPSIQSIEVSPNPLNTAENFTIAVAASADVTVARDKTTNIQSAWRNPMTLFKSLLYLGGLESIDSRIGEEEESFGPTYGNRVASERTFGKRAADPFHRRVVPVARNPSATLGCVAGGCS